MQKEMCVKCNLPFQEELYVDIGCSLEGAPVAVAKSKMAAPEIIYSWVLERAGAVPSTMDYPMGAGHRNGIGYEIEGPHHD
ncbi:hypothetical protein L207DRAFT_606286 [Hyaloscypha variabilis F]|uniref:Uncharacterized protein n=1 Tax=Hyaloscypha variabilis (strain UAMH 11265 / GT02V1 / F) TaxID=1149755 RepID=A0A2J6S8T2_HYAVF|nr:hypothetical protein L207DRAFT_606286 [Hyaloscypha variabilis F]